MTATRINQNFMASFPVSLAVAYYSLLALANEVMGGANKCFQYVSAPERFPVDLIAGNGGTLPADPRSIRCDFLGLDMMADNPRVVLSDDNMVPSKTLFLVYHAKEIGAGWRNVWSEDWVARFGSRLNPHCLSTERSLRHAETGYLQERFV